MYESPPQQPSGCRDVFVLTRAVFAIILPAVLALVAVLGAFMAALILLTVHPALVLIPVGVVLLGLYLFARWERKRFRPPEL
jgi:hypothetical protein